MMPYLKGEPLPVLLLYRRLRSTMGPMLSATKLAT